MSLSLTRGAARALGVGAAGLALLLAGCGSSSQSPTSAAAAASSGTTSSGTGGGPSASPGANAALPIALAPKDLPASVGSLSQTTDSLLAGTPNSDARAFANADSTIQVEIDVVIDTSPTAAASDYIAYQAAARKQATTLTASSTPAIGTRADEYTGMDGSGRSAASLAFTQGRVIAVVTMVAPAGTALSATVEAIAAKQAQKIASAHL
jgi:hypothetical protein